MKKTAEYLPDEYIEAMAETIKILGNAQRLKIIEFLDIEGESPVYKIIEGVAGAQSAVSQHLNKMKRAGLIASRRNKNEVYYRLTEKNPVTILNCMRDKFKIISE